MNVIHVTGESVIDLDAITATISQKGITRIMLASSYVKAGCDFSASTYEVSHVHYLRACVRYVSFLQFIDEEHETESMHFLTPLPYLEKLGFRALLNSLHKEELWEERFVAGSDDVDLQHRTKRFLHSEWHLVFINWFLDIKRYVSDQSKSFNISSRVRNMFWIKPKD